MAGGVTDSQARQHVCDEQALAHAVGNTLGLAEGEQAAQSREDGEDRQRVDANVAAVAAYRASSLKAAAPAPVRTDMNGDGKADIVWFNTDRTATSRWFMDGPRTIGGMLDLVPSSFQYLDIGDFDGDGRSDLFFLKYYTPESPSSGYIQWRPNATNAYVGYVLHRGPGRLIGTLDINGDGTSDFVTREIGPDPDPPCDGCQPRSKLGFMLMYGEVSGGTSSLPMQNAYRVVGMGDFDGDGRGDVLWADASNNHLLLWRMTDPRLYWEGDFVAYIPPGWEVAGTADMNGDGRTDIVWRNQDKTQTSRWFMDGPSRIGGALDTMSPDYRMVAINDFDGDGRADLLWTDEANSHLLMWRPDAAGAYRSDFVADVPAGWQVLNGTVATYQTCRRQSLPPCPAP